MPASFLACFATRHRCVDTIFGFLSIRRSSRRRFHVQASAFPPLGRGRGPLSQLHRYYSDAKTSSAPSRPSFVSFARAVPRLPHRFAPSRPTMPAPQGQDVCWWRTSTYRLLARGGQRISQVPAQTPLPPRTCSRDPGRTKRNLPCRSARLGHGYRNARDFFDDTFEAQLHGLMARCLRFNAPGHPGTMQDSLPIARLRSIGWVSHPQGLL